MLPQNLHSTYKQHKLEADVFASWLKTTTSALGFVSNLPLKLATRTSDQPPGTPTVPAELVYIVPMQEYTKMASMIAERRKKVPSTVRSMLNRMITTRELYPNTISPRLLDSAAKARADTKHASYLGILKRVLKILSRPTPRVYVRGSHRYDSDTSSDETYVSPALNEHPKYEAEPTDIMAEDFLMFHLMLSDLGKLRAEVTCSWERFKRGELDLVTASIVTNTAVDLARGLMDECGDAVSRYGGAHKVLHIIFEGECRFRGTAPQYREKKGDFFNFKVFDKAEEIFLIPCLVLLCHAENLKTGTRCEYDPDLEFHYNPKSDRSKKNARQRYDEDHYLILRVLPDFVALATKLSAPRHEDELTRGLRIMVTAKAVSLWLAFALQMYLDIHHVLREKVDAPFHNLNTLAAATLQNIRETEEYNQGLPHGHWESSSYLTWEYIVNYITNGLIRDPARRAAKMANLKEPPPFFYHRNHPWQCGLFVYHIKLFLHAHGTRYANNWGAIHLCQQLYETLRVENLLQNDWPDMDWLLAVRDYEHSYHSDISPNALEQALDSVLAAMGDSAKAWGPPLTADNSDPILADVEAYRKRFQETSTTDKNHAPLVIMVPVLGLFTERIFIPESYTFHTVPESHVQTILLLHARPYSGTAALTEYLPLLRSCCSYESPKFSIDLLTLHRTCWTFLQTIKSTCTPTLTKIYGSNLFDQENQLPFLVAYILHAATEQPAGNFLCAKRQVEEATPSLLLRAALAIQELVEDGRGDVVVRLAKEKWGFVLPGCEPDEDEMALLEVIWKTEFHRGRGVRVEHVFNRGAPEEDGGKEVGVEDSLEDWVDRGYEM